MSLDRQGRRESAANPHERDSIAWCHYQTDVYIRCAQRWNIRTGRIYKYVIAPSLVLLIVVELYRLFF